MFGCMPMEPSPEGPGPSTTGAEEGVRGVPPPGDMSQSMRMEYSSLTSEPDEARLKPVRSGEGRNR